MHAHGAYVLMTPARNEEANIARVLDTVASQTLLPLRWVIVDDGSSDRTAELVEKFAREHDFVHLLRHGATGERTFASKALALKAAYETLESLQFDFVGNLDADISLPADYYERMTREFAGNPLLGLVGGWICDVVDGREDRQDLGDVPGGKRIRQSSNLNSVAGAVQLFRRACFDAIGGYFPSQVGGIDTIAEVSARMHGWKVHTSPKICVLHHREMGTAVRGVLAAAWHAGRKDYGLGYHAVFYFLMCGSRMLKRPYLLGGVLRWTAYVCQALRGAPVEAPPNVVAFMRQEQRARLNRALHPQKWKNRSAGNIP